MPSPQSEDSDNSPAGTSQNSKVSSKNSSAVQIPTKNGKKNGKAKNGRGGGILEAVASKKASEQSYVSLMASQDSNLRNVPFADVSRRE